MHPVQCHNCSHSWDSNSNISRRDECPQCGSDVRVCLNCQFFDKHAAKQCKETSSELVPEKDRANFCGYFKAKSAQENSSSQEGQLDKLHALFGEDSPQQATTSNKDQLESLFSKDKSTDEHDSNSNQSLKNELEDFFKKK